MAPTATSLRAPRPRRVLARRAPVILALGLLAGALPLAGAAGARGRPPGPVGLQRPQYLKLFLNATDLTTVRAPNMRMVQDTRTKGADPRDTAYRTHRGVASGFAVWMANRSDVRVWRLVDIRWVFRSNADASAYYRATLRRNAEGNPRVAGAAPIGDECQVFGGTQKMAGVAVTHYFYIFRVANVVVKLYVAQGPNVYGEKDRLIPVAVTAIARKIKSRIWRIQQFPNAK